VANPNMKRTTDIQSVEVTATHITGSATAGVGRKARSRPSARARMLHSGKTLLLVVTQGSVAVTVTARETGH
jgi:hypothetical protein